MGYGEYYGGWAPYVSVADRRHKAELEIAKLRKKGQKLEPVALEGRTIVRTVWGKAWCDNLESYRDFAYRVDRGRSYVRNGLVIDLRITEREIKALVAGSETYRVVVAIDAVAMPQWRSMCKDCAGGIDSLIELLQGRLSQSVMQRLCRQGLGLLPTPQEIRFTCNCPDYALMCKHVAAVLYGVGARLDHQPELLFRLRAVDAKDLVTGLDQSLTATKKGRSSGKVLEANDLSAVFGLDMVEPETVPPAPKASTATKVPRKAKTTKVPRKAKTKMRARRQESAGRHIAKRKRRAIVEAAED